MLKTNSKEVKQKIREFIIKETTPNANDNNETNIEYLKRIYKQAQERTKGTHETPTENIINSCTCFFYGDYEIFEIVQSWTNSNYTATEKNINKALQLYYYLLDREITNLIK